MPDTEVDRDETPNEPPLELDEKCELAEVSRGRGGDQMY
jgi:hypothetical protein